LALSGGAQQPALEPTAVLQERAVEVLSEPSFQRALPGVDGPAAGTAEAGDEARRRAARDAGWLAALGRVGAIPARLVLYGLLIAIAVGLVLLLVLLFRDLAGRRRGSVRVVTEVAEGPATAAAAPPSPTAHPDLVQIEALAAAGDYTAALHGLLLLAVDRLRRERLATVRVSSTSREVLRSARLPAEPREALRALVATVEAAVFGGRAAGREDYERCRDGCRSLLIVGDLGR
jgi:hypothetical protein